MKLQVHIASKIVKRRKDLRITALKLAARAEIHRNAVSRAETGLGVSLETLWKICKVLNITLDSLFEDIKPETAIQLELWPDVKKWRIQHGPSLMPSNTNRRSNALSTVSSGLGRVGPGASGMRKPVQRAYQRDRERAEKILNIQERLSKLKTG